MTSASWATWAETRRDQFKLGIMLLTRLPMRSITGVVPTLPASTWAWPIIGAFIGLMTGGTYLVATCIGLPPILSAFVALAVSLMLTGAMHEDGLADLADGLGGGSSVEKKLEIMRDSRLGSYGAAAMILTIGLRISAMAAFADPWITLMACIGLSAASRSFMVPVLWLVPPARTNGQGAHASEVTARQTIYCLLIAFIIFACATNILTALTVTVTMGISTFLLSRVVIKQISGQTGDVLGATQQLAEMTGWLTLVVVLI
ncbi:adenosylcobinamide-GDP ribazoletransferase [Halocynthiibacter namhaensis]|uniref:adenosylcobinamide-GDP ribazoletransferase n=1 Tax=Halocynthiibacter namhaensis TaxID=1290553 RepID=UPI00068FC5B9|nr:adenosylcobinamide-GDP ribazoletransferase [Halocynthiibacter namhaensis]